MKKSIRLILFSLCVLLIMFVISAVLLKITIDKDKPKVDEPLETVSYKNATEDNIRVELPFAGAVVGKQFSIIGEARGYWFFEASFPIEIIDENGKTISQAIAQANGEWMTTNFVPFKTDISIPQDFIGKATVVLKKDNPSGLPENDASLSIPITIEY